MSVPAPSAPIPDPVLVAAYRQGDEAAATELVRRHAPSLARFLFSSGAEQSDIDDLVQDTFFRAFRGLDGWRGDSSFRTWVLTIGGNLLRDEFRKRKGRRMLSLDDRDLPDYADPHAELTAAEAETRLRAELARLPRLQREVFLLRVQEGCDYDSIAVALGTTPGAARVHYHHAVKRLKELVR